MVTLRCTQVIRGRLHLPKDLPEPPPSTCALGDWYVHLVRFGRAAMEPIAFGRTTNRRVLGSMNDLAFQASVHVARGDDLLAISRRLAETPMSAIGAKRGDFGYPVKIARDLLITASLQ